MGNNRLANKQTQVIPAHPDAKGPLMKTNFFTAIAIIFIQGFALLASAHASGLYGIPKLPDAEAIDLHDGSLDDWTSLFSEPTIHLASQCFRNPPSPRTTSRR